MFAVGEWTGVEELEVEEELVELDVVVAVVAGDFLLSNWAAEIIILFMAPCEFLFYYFIKFFNEYNIHQEKK